MKDENDRQLDELFAAVRSIKPDTSAIEKHFETRLLARIEEQRSSQTLWSAWAWRLIPWFATIVVVVGIGSVFFDPTRSSDLFATFTSGFEEYQTTSLLAGG
jgi:hypothetical protein